MGQASAMVSEATSCCREEQLLEYPVELDTECVLAGSAQDSLSRGHQFDMRLFQSAQYREGHEWGCFKADGSCEAAFEHVGMPGPRPHPMALESVSYVPTRFDESSTIDVERSHARYSKIVVHSARVRTQRRSKTWEDWVRGAIAGQSVTLLRDFFPDSSTSLSSASAERVAAWYNIDRGLTKLSILADPSTNMSPITISVDSIQVICPAADFLLFLEQEDSGLDEPELSRAVMLQYVNGESQRRRVCFLEESLEAKDRFVQALTALWLEKRNDHSMWF